MTIKNFFSLSLFSLERKKERTVPLLSMLLPTICDYDCKRRLSAFYYFLHILLNSVMFMAGIEQGRKQQLDNSVDSAKQKNERRNERMRRIRFDVLCVISSTKLCFLHAKQKSIFQSFFFFISCSCFYFSFVLSILNNLIEK